MKIKILKIAAIGDKDLVYSIADNFKKFGYEKCKLLKNQIFSILIQKKKIVDKKNVLKEFFYF